MEIVSNIGRRPTRRPELCGLLGITGGGRATYYTRVAPFKGKPLHFERAISQAMEVGVRCLPILSLITVKTPLVETLGASIIPQLEESASPGINKFRNWGR